MKNYISIVLLLLVSTVYCVGQNLDLVHYTTSNTGTNPLPSSKVYCLSVDPSGFVWIGCKGKIIKFNGTDWLPFEFDHDTLGNGNVITFEPNGNFWKNGYGEVFYFDISTEQWSSLALTTIPPSSVTDIIIDNTDRLWIGTQSGIVMKDGPIINTFTTTNGLSYDVVTKITQTNNGNIWVGTFQGLNEWDGTNWIVHDFEILFGSGHTNSVSCLWQDQTGVLWAGNTDKLYYYDGTTWNFIDITITTGFTTSNGLLNTIIQDDAGIFYFGFQSDGIVTWDGTSWEHLTMASGLTSNHVLCGINDGAGRVWFGFSSGGIMIHENGAWDSWTTWDGLTENQVYSIFEDSQNKVWLMTENGINIWEDEIWGSYKYNFNEYSYSGTIKEDVNGRIVYPNGNYINFFNGQDWEVVFGLSNVVRINDLICVGSDTIYLGHRNGFTRAIGPDWNLGSAWYNFTGLPNNWVNALALWNDDIWIGTNEGLAYSDGISVTPVQIPGEEIGTKITDLIVDLENNLWIATDQGAVRYDGSSWDHFTEIDGLLNNNITCLEISKDSSIWFGTKNEGACQLNDTNWFYFTMQDGLIDNRVKCIEEDQYGNLWFGTWKGVTKMLADTTSSNNNISAVTENSVSVYPNPGNEVLTIGFPVNIQNTTLRLFEISGKAIVVRDLKENKTRINTEELTQGIYFYNVSQNGKIIGKGKWVKVE
jgi:ligand-binding sensor domain-containing protein